MKILKTEIDGVKILEPDFFKDARGYFTETYNAQRYRATGVTADFVQDNESFSQKGVVRGLHWQAAPYTQAKLVRVSKGAVWDVAVDIRKGSSTFGRSVSAILCAPGSVYAAAHPEIVIGRQFFLPRGFAHGFVVLEDDTLFSYKCDNFYNKASERGLMFDDPALAIQWPALDVPILLSEKDRHHPHLADIEPWEELAK